MDIYTEKDGIFKGRTFLGNVFGRTPTDMFKAGNLNLTFDDTSIKVGDADGNGNYDGVYGLLQRNESDFSVFPLAFEALRGTCECPVKVISLTGDTKYSIVTNPIYNRTMILSDIEDSISAIKPGVMLFYLILFFVIRGLITSARGSFTWERNKIQRNHNKRLTWNMFRLILKQGSNIKFALSIQSLLFSTYELSIAILIVLYVNHISADLVSYNKPHLLNSLQDVWNAGNDVKISFTEATNVAGLFKNCPNDSLARKLYERSLSQWTSTDSNFLNYHLFPSQEMLKGPDLIKEHKMALFALDIPVRILLGLECKNILNPDDPPLKYSSLHVSKESFLKEQFVMVTSLSINPELELRLTKYNRRMMDHGLHERTLSKGAELTIDSLPIGKPPSTSCLHTKAWKVIPRRILNSHFTFSIIAG